MNDPSALLPATVPDFSVRKDAERQLAQMEGRYRGLLEAAPDAMVVINPKGEIILLNLQAEKQFGYRRDELIGQPVTNIIPEGFAERLVADGLRSEEDALAQQIGTGIELTGLRKDASEFPIELMLSPLDSAEGVLVTAAIRDISVRKAADRQVVRMEGRYRGLLEAAPDAMVVINAKGEIILLNLQAEKQFGYRRDELIGQPVTNIIPEGFAERLVSDGLRSEEDALAQQIGTGIELTGLRKDASEFPIELMLSPLDSAEGVLVTAAIRDISVRKAAEEVLGRMEGRYRGLLEAAPDAMVVVNPQGEIVLLNLQAEKQFGYRRDELIGQPVTNIIPDGFAERLVADGLRSEEDALAQQIGTGIELTGLRKDASEFPIELMLSPLDSAEGVLVTAAIRDISVRKAAEEVLGRMEGRYRGLLEAAPDAMVVVNPQGEIVLLNLQAEKQFGYRRDELIGQPVTNIIPDGFAERLVADGLRSEEDALAQQIGTGIELTGLRKDASEFPIELMLSPLDSAEGVLVTAAIRDISVRKAAERHSNAMAAVLIENEAELRQSAVELKTANEALESANINLQAENTDRQKAQEELRLLNESLERHVAERTLELTVANRELETFAYTVSHDLRAPLRHMDGFSQALLEDYGDKLDDEGKDFLARIRSGSVRMGQLIDALLNLSRLSRGKLDRRDVDISAMANRVFAELQLSEISRKVGINISPRMNALADNGLLGAVFENLLGNAWKFTSKNPEAKISVGRTERDSKRVFFVKDNGVGFDMAYVEKLFAPFQRLHTTAEFEGTGIGLATVARIIQRHGGEVWVESALNEGTTVFFTL